MSRRDRLPRFSGQAPPSALLLTSLAADLILCQGDRMTHQINTYMVRVAILCYVIIIHLIELYLSLYSLHCRSFFELINYPFAVHAHVHHNSFRREKLLCVILHWQCCIIQNCTLDMHDRTSVLYSGIVLH